MDTNAPLEFHGSRIAAAKVRSILEQFRLATGAGGAALLFWDRDGQTFHCGASRSLPHVQRHVVHCASECCLLLRALDRGQTARARFAKETCPTCLQVFGAPAQFAVPLSLEGYQPALLVAFSKVRRSGAIDAVQARRLANHLSDYLTGYGMARRANRRASQLAAVSEVAASLNRILEPEVLLPKILAEIARMVPQCDQAVLRVFDPEKRTLRLVAAKGLSEEQRSIIEQEDVWSRMAGAVFRSKQASVLKDVQHYLTQHPRQQGADPISSRSALWVPIVFGGEALGIIAFSSSNRDAFDSEVCNLAFTLANHAAIAITNARLYHEVDVRLQSKLLHLSKLGQMARAIASSLGLQSILRTIVQATAEAFSAEGSSIAMLDGQGSLIVRAAFGTGAKEPGARIPVEGTIGGWVVLHGQPVVVTNVENAPSSTAKWPGDNMCPMTCVPLFHRGEVVGCLDVHLAGTQTFLDSDLVHLQDIAEHAGIAIEHANLYEVVAREKAKFEAIVESLHEGVGLVDCTGKVIHANRRFIDLLTQNRDRVPTLVSDICESLAIRSETPYEARARLTELVSTTDPAKLVTIGIVTPTRQDIEIESFAVQTSAGDALGRGYLLRDITEQAAAERLKESILSTVSHELITPLAAIKGFATSLLRTDVKWDSASRIDFTQQIDCEVDRLGALVRNLLDLSQLQAGVLVFNRECMDLKELISGVLSRMAPLLENHNVHLSVPRAKVQAAVDRTFMERVLWNLLDNAAKYSPVNSRIDISLRRAGGTVMIDVADRGIGIEKEDLPYVFDRFHRGIEARSLVGAGLGLTICRGVVEGHSGTINVDSIPGSGTVFHIKLPGVPARARLRGMLTEAI